MKLAILSCEARTKGSYLLLLKYGNQELAEEITISKGVVPYIKYSEKLRCILHKDAGEARNMNQTMFKIYRGIEVGFPAEIGDF